MKMNSVSFGHHIVIDSGAHFKENGSFKISVRSDFDEGEIYPGEGKDQDPSLEKVCPEGFTCSEDYTDGLAKRTVDTYGLMGDRIANLKNPKDRELTGIVIHAPGPAIGNQAKISPNLKIRGTDKSLTDIDYTVIPDRIQSLLAQRGIKVKVSDNVKLVATNDMLGSGAGIAKYLAENTDKYVDKEGDPIFKEGFFGTVFMPGGGLGICYIRHRGDKVEIEASESGHNDIMGTGPSLESQAASVPALIRNYADSVGYDEQKTEKLVKIGNAKIVTQYPVIAEKGTESQALQSTGLFKDPEDIGNGQMSFKPKFIDKDVHEEACKEAMGKFIDAAATMCAVKANECCNAVIMAGPLVSGIKKDLAKNPSILGGKTLEEAIVDRMETHLDQAGKDTAKLYGFRLITDIKIKDNTVGGKLVLKSEFCGKNRGNWMEINAKDLA